jgi:hypothetical protein
VYEVGAPFAQQLAREKNAIRLSFQLCVLGRAMEHGE